jgi:hypothetical protein
MHCSQQWSGSGRGVCVFFVCAAAVIILVMMTCAAPSGKPASCEACDGRRFGASCALPPQGSTSSEAPTPLAAQRRAVRAPNPDWEVSTQTAGKLSQQPNLGTTNVAVGDVVNVRANQGGAPFLSSTFAPSETTAEFYDAFNPVSLSNLMPSNWRPEGKCGPESQTLSPDATYSDFSRYTVTPMAAQRAESMRGVIRLSELSSTRNARTLGTPSLLRSFVTPTQPVPIGDKAFVFNDSSVRQGYIAAATGDFPKDTSC